MTLQDDLCAQLPKDAKFKLLHIQTKPTYIKSPIHYQHNQNQNHSQSQVLTIKIRHLIQLIDEEDLVVLGIEVYVYIQVFPDRDSLQQTIFISKCDTVGLTKMQFRVNHIIQVIIRWLISVNLYDYKIKVVRPVKAYKPIDPNDYNDENDTIISIKKLIKKLSTNPNFYSTLPYYNENNNHKQSAIGDDEKNLLSLPAKQTIKLCLFTKAAQQYLYPYSSKNSFKHIINGTELLKWWLKTIDKILINDNDEHLHWSCRLSIPGSDKLSTEKFFQDLTNHEWSIGNIYESNNEGEGEDQTKLKPNDLAINHIPIYPDDPKGRFLEHLIVEHRYHKLTIEQFYNELGFRQEFRLGNLVGLIGCKCENIKVEKERQPSQTSAVILTIHQYKQLVNNLIKSESFTNKNDIQSLVREKIPHYLERLNKDDVIYHELIGKKIESTTTSVKPAEQVINTLTVKRKPVATDLTNLIRKKKK